MQSHQLGGRLGRYVLKHEVATGGMATVYLAQLEGARGFDRWFAVKLIHRHLARDRKFVNMFLDEARVTAKLHHPNVCSIIEFGEDVAPHIVMEYLHGETLAAVIRHGWKKKNLPLWLGARAVGDAARGLHAAHELVDDEGQLINLIHRDVSPQNIMVLYEGVSKMVDFGVARARGRLTQTEAQEVKGKIAYMSPEQLHGQPIDRRSDIWALGVVLWEATVGARLFRGETDGETTLNVIHKEIPRPSKFRQNYPKALEDAIMSALERDVNARVKTAAELADAIDTALYAMGKQTGTPQVANWMNEMFAERRKQREVLLRSDSTLQPSFEIEPPSQESIGPVPLETSGMRVTPSSASSSQILPNLGDAAAPKSKKPGAAVWIGGAALLLALGGLGWWATRGPAPTPPLGEAPPTIKGGDVSVTEPAVTPPASPAVVPAPTAATEPAGTLAADGGVATPDTLLDPEPPRPTKNPRPITPRPKAAPKVVAGPPGKINVMFLGGEADVFLDGKKIGETPILGFSVPAGEHSVEIRGEGGKSKRKKIEVTSSKTTGVSIPNLD